jgi:hypothetical protein
MLFEIGTELLILVAFDVVRLDVSDSRLRLFKGNVVPL